MKLKRVVIIKDKMIQITTENPKSIEDISANGYIVLMILNYMFARFEITDNEHAPNISFIMSFDYIGENISGFTISNKKIGDFHYGCKDYGFDYFDDLYTDDSKVQEMIKDIEKDFNLKSSCPCKWYEQEFIYENNIMQIVAKPKQID